MKVVKTEPCLAEYFIKGQDLGLAPLFEFKIAFQPYRPVLNATNIIIKKLYSQYLHPSKPINIGRENPYYH
jgi:hypothetical protein